MLIAFTLFHVVLSLIGIGAGFVFASDLLQSRDRTGWTNTFLVSTIATSVTGFFFPVDHITPAHIFGVISLAVLALAVRARGRVSLSAGWRRSYVISTLFALYLNVFVLVVQMFQKIGPLNALAPTQTEGPFQFAQTLVLLGFCALGFLALRNYRPTSKTQPVAVAATA